MTIAVQLAFQGGGARLSAFFPAIMALQELGRAGVIAVKRVSGASAGAIAAAFFAGRANIPALIEFCKGLEA
ncbi:patatin-like phospholipase family protein, partial [Neorhizobium galegae]|uniref:patatin-like phospholipase family protein n=1 Tax=Neorhizobium galegae TaxID=399 RepID=UPI002105B88B